MRLRTPPTAGCSAAKPRNPNVANSARRAKHFRYSETSRDVKRVRQKYSSFRNIEFMI
jgi:hypothetical protein